MRSSLLVAAAATTALAFELGGAVVPRHLPHRTVAVRCCDALETPRQTLAVKIR